MPKDIKLTELQTYKLHQARQLANQVLSEIKRTPLKGACLETMKLLENAVTEIDLVTLRAGH